MVNKYAGKHLVDLALEECLAQAYACDQCGHVTKYRDKYCGDCGHFVEPEKTARIGAIINSLRSISPDTEHVRPTPEQRREMDNYVFPVMGIYIYHHPYEGYKIGQAENISRRMGKHLCSAPSSELLHVIETSDLDWCERFLHNKFRQQRIRANHEYFDLSRDDLDWLFSIKVLEPPRTLDAQLSLLDLL